MVSILNTFDSVLMVENVFEIQNSERIYQQLLNIRCNIYNNNFLTAKRLTDQKSLDPIFNLFYFLCISQLYIIGILNFSKSPALLKDETLKSTLCNYSLKKWLKVTANPLLFLVKLKLDLTQEGDNIE